MTRGPVLIDMEDSQHAAPEEAPQVIDAPQGAAMQHVAALAARKPSRLAAWFWSLLLALVGFIVSLAAWDYVTTLVARSPVLGGVITVLLGLFCLVLLVIALRELAAFSRLKRVDSVQLAAQAALSAGDLSAARDVVAKLKRLYKGREDTTWGRTRRCLCSTDRQSAHDPANCRDLRRQVRRVWQLASDAHRLDASCGNRCSGCWR